MREGPRAPPLDINVSVMSEEASKERDQVHQGPGRLAPGVAVRYSVPSLC